MGPLPPLALFGQALLVGLSIAAPVGPIGLLCIQRTLDQGLRVGLATGLGSAVADAIYGAIGAFCISVVIAWLSGARPVLGLVGGLFLMALGVRIWRSARAGVRRDARGTGAARRGRARLRIELCAHSVEPGDHPLLRRRLRRAGRPRTGRKPGLDGARGVSGRR